MIDEATRQEGLNIDPLILRLVGDGPKTSYN
jgi:hypothetical protein